MAYANKGLYRGSVMDFDEKRVYTSASADKVKVGSKGFFADNMTSLKDIVIQSDTREDLLELREIQHPCCLYRFMCAHKTTWNLFYLVEEPEDTLCTHKELAYWLIKGNGEYKFSHDNIASTYYSYSLENEDSPVEEYTFQVRRWGDNKWHTPTRAYMGFA